MKALYSIAIHPSEDIIALVKCMKEELAAKIDWFNSKNSLHISPSTSLKLQILICYGLKSNLAQLCDTLQPVEVHFDSYGSYLNNGAFFISPDNASKKSLKVIMKHINDGFLITTKFKSSDPHLSIARRLTPEKLAVANGLFPPIALSFLCNSVVIRKFNQEVRQFDVIDEFTFNGNPPLFVQGSLF